MALELTRDYQLRWMDFDRYGRMRPTAILDIFQDLAMLHAEEIDIGQDFVIERGVLWVVIRSKLELVAQPEHFQVVRVRTWPHSLTSFSFMRDFTMHDEQGRLLAKASQEWVLMDARTRKFASAKGIYEGEVDFCEDRVFEKKARKTPAFEEGNRPIKLMTPSFTDIDPNGHVNNAMYANFVENALEPGDRRIWKTIQIDYRYEALPGQTFSLHTLVEDARVLFKGVSEEGTMLFAAMLE